MGSVSSYEDPKAVLGNDKFEQDTRIAVIGAGVSGIATAGHLLKLGANVSVFERSSVSSGVWHFDSRVTNSPSYPSETPSAGDYKTSSPGQFSLEKQKQRGKSGSHPLDSSDPTELQVAFSPPGPCYAGLKNNVPTTLMYSTLGPWPDGTPDFTEHGNLEKYLQGLSSKSGVDDVTLFNTRVEAAKKSADGKTWDLRTVTLLKGEGEPRLIERNWTFDALVVASGHYNLPRVPTLPGLSEWKASFPSRVIHSKEYRYAETFRDKNILIVGGGTSAMDVCRETHEHAKSVTQSTRDGEFDLPASILPESVKRVGAIDCFVTTTTATNGSSELAPSDHLPGYVLLKDGTKLTDIDHVILATGYINSYPFLSQFHADNTPIDAATRDILVTAEGSMIHNLYKDIFYTEDPSLSFVGVPYYSATFSLFDFQAQVVARILTGKSRLPDLEARRQEYDTKVATKGRGRKFHSLAESGAELAYVEDIVTWVNDSAEDSTIEPVPGHTEEWKHKYELMKEKMRQLRQGSASARFP